MHTVIQPLVSPWTTYQHHIQKIIHEYEIKCLPSTFWSTSAILPYQTITIQKHFHTKSRKNCTYITLVKVLNCVTHCSLIMQWCIPPEISLKIWTWTNKKSQDFLLTVNKCSECSSLHWSFFISLPT